MESRQLVKKYKVVRVGGRYDQRGDDEVYFPTIDNIRDEFDTEIEAIEFINGLSEEWNYCTFTITPVYNLVAGEIRIVAEMDDYGMLHIFNETQLEHYE